MTLDSNLEKIAAPGLKSRTDSYSYVSRENREQTRHKDMRDIPFVKTGTAPEPSVRVEIANGMLN
jgi:hypothetical protein